MHQRLEIYNVYIFFFFIYNSRFMIKRMRDWNDKNKLSIRAADDLFFYFYIYSFIFHVVEIKLKVSVFFFFICGWG